MYYGKCKKCKLEAKFYFAKKEITSQTNKQFQIDDFDFTIYDKGRIFRRKKLLHHCMDCGNLVPMKKATFYIFGRLV